jgi:hypothetical protein
MLGRLSLWSTGAQQPPSGEQATREQLREGFEEDCDDVPEVSDAASVGLGAWLIEAENARF